MNAFDYDNWKREALIRGWHVPPASSRMAEPDFHLVWIRYWQAMAVYEDQLAAGNPDPGRPVVPHRTGRA